MLRKLSTGLFFALALVLIPLNASALTIFATDINIIPTSNTLFQQATISSTGTKQVIIIQDLDSEFLSSRTGVSDGAHYENIDTDELLDLIEEFAGLALLASNLIVTPENKTERALLENLFKNIIGEITGLTAVNSIWLAPRGAYTPVPEPSTALLIIAGLVGLVAVARCKRLINPIFTSR